MKKAALTSLAVLLATPALAHPGDAHEHASLGMIEHLALTALPTVMVAAAIALAVVVLRRRT